MALAVDTPASTSSIAGAGTIAAVTAVAEPADLARINIVRMNLTSASTSWTLGHKSRLLFSKRKAGLIYLVILYANWPPAFLCPRRVIECRSKDTRGS